MKRIIKSYIIKSFIILSFLGLILTVTGCNNKIHYYDEIISTSNIKKIEVKKKNSEDLRYYIDEYFTLTHRETNWFIINLKREDLKYTYTNKTNDKIESNKDIFIVSYNDGSKIYFDNYHVLKKDKNDDIIFDKKVVPYNCVIGQNMIVDETDINLRKSRQALIEFENEGYLYTQISRNYYNRIINNYRSNDYFNILRVLDGKILEIYKTDYTYKDQFIYQIIYEGYEYDKYDPMIEHSTQETIYVVDDKYATPIQTTTIKGWYDEDSIKVVINLYTGDKTEYKYPFPK